MSRLIFHELQIEAVQHGAGKEVFHSFNSHSILGKNAATGYPSCPPLPSDKVRHGDGLEESSAMQTPIFQNGRLRFQSFCR